MWITLGIMGIRDKRHETGQRGEDIACLYLERLGFKIIDRNYRRPWGEIDVIAQKGNDLRFVEVKTVVRNIITPLAPLTLRGEEDDYEPEENIHPWKRRRLRRIIETYLLQNDLPDEVEWQIDAIAIYLNPAGELLKTEYLEDIVL